MKFDDLKARWSGYSTRKKWTIAGVGALVCVAAAGAGNPNDQGPARGGAGSQFAGRGGYAGEGPSEGQQYSGAGYAGAAPAGGGMGGYAAGGVGGYAGAAPVAAGGAAAPDDTMSRWEANERVQDRAAAAFDQNIRDESTVRDTGTGEVVSGVSNPAADAAVDSGAATVVPTSELPVSSDPGE
jgi:hypothetical protein